MDPSKETSGFTFPNDGERPLIRDYHNSAKFFVNDRVNIRGVGGQAARGPFVVDSIENGQYKLRDKDRNLVDDGKLFGEDELEESDPFA